MKMTRLCGLVALAFVAILIFSVPAQALDHPWDGTKLTDTTTLSSTTGTNNNPTGDENGGDGCIAPTTRKWYSVFVGWITDIIGNNEVEKVEQSSNSKAVPKKVEGEKKSLNISEKSR